jgi:hypothetical protein
MRDLTKSVVSYSWSMSLFGVQQMVNLLRPSQATKAFDNVTQATEDEFGDVLKATFTVGDNLQRRLVDLSFSVFTLGGALNPSGGTQGTAAASSTQATPTSGPGSQPQPTGWGPVPPPPGK